MNTRSNAAKQAGPNGSGQELGKLAIETNDLPRHYPKRSLFLQTELTYLETSRETAAGHPRYDEI